MQYCCKEYALNVDDDQIKLTQYCTLDIKH